MQGRSWVNNPASPLWPGWYKGKQEARTETQQPPYKPLTPDEYARNQHIIFTTFLVLFGLIISVLLLKWIWSHSSNG